MKILTPWLMFGEYADGYECYKGGLNEEDCMRKLIAVENTGNHGSLVFYTGVNDEDYINGELISYDSTD